MNRWYRLPETGTGTEQDPLRPDLQGHGVDGWIGNTAHPEGAPHWIVRVDGDADVLDALAAESQVVALDSVPVQALNQMLGQERDAEEWERGFGAGL